MLLQKPFSLKYNINVIIYLLEFKILPFSIYNINPSYHYHPSEISHSTNLILTKLRPDMWAREESNLHSKNYFDIILSFSTPMTDIK